MQTFSVVTVILNANIFGSNCFIKCTHAVQERWNDRRRIKTDGEGGKGLFLGDHVLPKQHDIVL